ncbi:MAG TPA: hypothetical protein VNL16_01025 [Chloroflexota bacterium]|nr:hypothetical protein [Chloroflexota bacterium]
MNQPRPTARPRNESRQRVLDQLAVILPGEFFGVRVAASVAQ